MRRVAAICGGDNCLYPLCSYGNDPIFWNRMEDTHRPAHQDTSLRLHDPYELRSAA